MIVKILTRHSPSYESLLKYILQEDKTKDEKQITITHNIRSHDPKDWPREFIQNEAFRKYPRSNQIYLYHEILSFSSREDEKNVTPEMIEDISRQYINLRGNKGIYIGVPHRDKDHVHIHFCTSGLEYRNGKAFRLSKEDLHLVKTKLQEYHKEKYPQIDQSTVGHGKGKAYVTDREWYATHKAQRTLHKETLKHHLKDAFSKAKTQNEFLALLREAGLHHYERNGKPTGIVFEDMKFRFTRLGMEKEQLYSLPIDKTEEQKVLDEIQHIRESRSEISKDHEAIDIDYASYQLEADE
jgi:hypothetical protein